MVVEKSTRLIGHLQTPGTPYRPSDLTSLPQGLVEVSTGRYGWEGPDIVFTLPQTQFSDFNHQKCLRPDGMNYVHEFGDGKFLIYFVENSHTVK